MKNFTLKHIVMAFIVGVLVMISGQALADTVSQIGNKVDSEATVYVNGEKVSDAIIIKGKSYVPGRDVAEALGGTVEWKGSENSIMITNNLTTDEEIAEHNRNNEMYIQAYATAKAKVDGSKREIERLQSFIEEYNEEYISQYSEQIRNLFFREVEKANKELEEAKANLAKYEKELAELEAGK